MTAATILTLQSSVASGHVGNAAAGFVLQRLGCEVLRVDTVRFSNHPAHGGFSGGPAAAAEIDVLVEGLGARGLLVGVDAVLSGYLGTADNAGAVARAVAAVADARRAGGRPAPLYALDPVMGDHPKGLFVQPDIPDAIRRHLLVTGDLLLPNRFELELLTGRSIATAEDAVGAARILMAAGPARTVVTAVEHGHGLIQTLAIDDRAAWCVETSRVAAPSHGTGDTFAALFLSRFLEKPDLSRALSLAVSSIHAVLEETRRLGRRELALIPAQEELVAPAVVFEAVALA